MLLTVRAHVVHIFKSVNNYEGIPLHVNPFLVKKVWNRFLDL